MRNFFAGAMILLLSIYSPTAKADGLCNTIANAMKTNPEQSGQFITGTAAGFAKSLPSLAKQTATQLASELLAYCTSHPDGDGEAVLGIIARILVQSVPSARVTQPAPRLAPAAPQFNVDAAKERCAKIFDSYALQAVCMGNEREGYNKLKQE